MVSPKLLPVCLSSRKAIRLALPLLSAMAHSGGHGLCLPSFSKVKTAQHLSVGYLCAWGMFSLMMFVATLTKPKVLSGIFFCLTLTFFALGIGDGMRKSQHRPYRRLLRFGNCTWCVLLGSGRSHQRIFRPYGFADWRT